MSDGEVINVEKALEQVADDREFLMELLHDVLNDEEKSIENLQTSLEKKDHKLFHESAHGVKGAALNLALTSLAEASYRAELIGRTLDHAVKTGLSKVKLYPHKEGEEEELSHWEKEAELSFQRVKEEYQRLRKHVETMDP